MLLYLVRHGETEWNKVKRMQGQTDTDLAQEGIQMAKECGEKMKHLPIDLVISSPLKRAYQTAQLIIADREIPIFTDDRIKEISFGDYEGERILESKVIPADFKQIFYESPMQMVTPPNGESFSDVLLRTKAFLEDLIQTPEYQDKHILISSHGVASRCLLNHFCEDKSDIWHGCVPPNCSVSTVTYENGVFSVLEIDHLYYKDE